MPRLISFIVFLLIVMGGGFVIGISTAPGAWYAGLAKPPFNPPNWIFGPIWTVIYLMIAVVGWRLWHQPASGGLLRLWVVQLLLNFLWSPVFFAAQSPGPALAIILALLATIVAFVIRARTVDRVSALLFVPYMAWVAFASLLNAAIFTLNSVG